MPHPFFVREGRRPLVFAHRGGSALAPENTLAAFANGVALGSDGIELDVHLSRDGVAVVHHDSWLDRTTALAGPVAARTADELRRAGVPALADVLRAHPAVRVIVELKVNSPDMAAAIVGTVRGAGAVDRTCVGAFGSRVLRAVRSLEPSLATSASREEVRWALYRQWMGWDRWASRVRLDTVGSLRAAYAGFQVPELAGTTRVVSPRFVAAAHAAGLGVQVWTVDLVEDAKRLIDWGVDGLITDRPDIIVPLVHQRGVSTI